ncbi:hypothetical protein PCH70_50120 [Pseudomonas cichorii JBC1]|nr:hypothetical protein PCH70_50120 [Pseudomonas cichorii JBC1]
MASHTVFKNTLSQSLYAQPVQNENDFSADPCGCSRFAAKCRFSRLLTGVSGKNKALQ